MTAVGNGNFLAAHSGTIMRMYSVGWVWLSLAAFIGSTALAPLANAMQVEAAVFISDATVLEGDTGMTSALFTVWLGGAMPFKATVDYATGGGTATAGIDYQPASGTVTFAPGELSQTITVMVKGDMLIESDETFYLFLSNPVNTFLGGGGGLGTIRNDDGPPLISIDDVSVMEGNEGTAQAVFTVRLAFAPLFLVSVDYATADGTATEGTDYQHASGTLNFAPGETSKTITVQVNGDLTFEPDERFIVSLSGPVNAIVAADNYGTGIIRNDDPPPTLSINDATVIEGDSENTPVVFTVSLTGATAQYAMVAYTTSDGTATAGSDYQPVTGSLFFVNGETSKTITVLVMGDPLVEPDETFYINLSNPVNAMLARAQAVASIHDDDAVVVLDRYASWLQTQFTAAQLADPTQEASVWGLNADPDGDGQVNLLEYALGTPPTSSVDAGQGFTTAPMAGLDGDHLTVTCRQRKNDPSLQFLPEFSADLQSWFSDSSHVHRLSRIDLDAEFEEVVYEDLALSTPGIGRFFRMTVQKN